MLASLPRPPTYCEPRYLELGCLELLAIFETQSIVLGFPFSFIYCPLSRTPRFLELFFVSLAESKSSRGSTVCAFYKIILARLKSVVCSPMLGQCRCKLLCPPGIYAQFYFGYKSSCIYNLIWENRGLSISNFFLEHQGQTVRFSEQVTSFPIWAWTLGVQYAKVYLTSLQLRKEKSSILHQRMRHRTPIKWVDFSLPKDSKRTLDLSEQQSKHSATPRHQQLFSNQNVGGHMPAATRDEKG